MNETDGRVTQENGRQTRIVGETQTRAVGSPLPIGGTQRQPLGVEGDQPPVLRGTPPPGRSLPPATGSASVPRPPATGFQRAIGALKLAMPLVQKIIPLLDGNVATTVSSLLAPPTSSHNAPPANLARIEGGMAELEAAHRELAVQVNEQNSSLRRVEDQLEMVREATDRNTLEQQELMEDLRSVGNKVNVLALLFLALLILSIALNIGMFLHIRRVIP